MLNYQMKRYNISVLNFIIIMSILVCTALNCSITKAESSSELLPNGSFEWVEHINPDWVANNKNKFELSGPGPILPVTWNLDKPGRYAIESAPESVHSGKYAFTMAVAPRFRAENAPWDEAQISCGWIEVRREDTYNISVFVKGKGNFHVYLTRQKPEGIDGELLQQINLTDSWQELSFTRRFPGNISQIKLSLTLIGDKESKEKVFATIDDASIKTTGVNTTPVPFLSEAPKFDEDTLLLEHYDGNFNAKALPYGEITLNSIEKASFLCDEAVLLQREGKLDKAEEKFKSALAEAPNYGRAYPLLGALYQDQKRYNEAEMMYRKQIEAHPEGTTGWNNLGALFLLQKRWDEASDAYQKSLDLNWNQPEIINSLSHAREESKKLNIQ